jgi:RNA polymerase sigma-70 factor (ECF subfamily)
MTERRLVDLFLPHLSAEAMDAIGSLDRLELALSDALELARGTFSEIPLPTEPFLAHLAQRIPNGARPDEILLELKVADLYLACACLRGVPQAVARFESEYLVDVRAALARMETATMQIEDVKQMICQKLLVGDAGSPPRLARYAGSGDLRSWLCVVAVRAALDQLRKEKDTDPLDDGAMADAVAPEEDQELQYLKRLYRTEFKGAFEEALASLTTRERNILRHQVLDGLTLDQIGAIYNVHRATVARWNAKLRERLLGHTRRALLSRLNATQTEFESIMRLIQSHLDVSIRRHLTREEE